MKKAQQRLANANENDPRINEEALDRQERIIAVQDGRKDMTLTELGFRIQISDALHELRPYLLPLAPESCDYILGRAEEQLDKAIRLALMIHIGDQRLVPNMSAKERTRYEKLRQKSRNDEKRNRLENTRKVHVKQNEDPAPWLQVMNYFYGVVANRYKDPLDARHEFFHGISGVYLGLMLFSTEENLPAAEAVARFFNTCEEALNTAVKLASRDLRAI